jgi:hypothetical protein
LVLPSAAMAGFATKPKGWSCKGSNGKDVGGGGLRPQCWSAGGQVEMLNFNALKGTGNVLLLFCERRMIAKPAALAFRQALRSSLRREAAMPPDILD